MSDTGGRQPVAMKGKAAVDILMRPKSVAIIGMSSKPNTAGHVVLQNLRLNHFAGDIHLVGRSGGEVDGLTVLTAIDDLPFGVDLAIFTLPAAGVKEALEGCARRGVRAVTIFSSGFAEAGNAEGQRELVRIAKDGGIAMLGPNCLGYTNIVDGFAVGFAGAREVVKLPVERRDPAVALVSQSGGLMAYARGALDAVNIPASYTVSTGNEAGVSLADFLEFFADDPSTDIIALYLEEVRDPPAFLAAARYARSKGKPVVMIHPGRSAEAKAAVQSHTGALAGDYDVMRVHLARAGIALVDTLEQWMDVTEFLARFPTPPVKGPGFVTFSGGFCAIAHDFCAGLALDVPPLSAEIQQQLAEHLPKYIPPRNPLDLGTEVIWRPQLAEIGARGLADDPAVGTVCISIAVASQQAQRDYGFFFLDVLKEHRKPGMFVLPVSELAPEFAAALKDNRIIFSRSVERSISAIALATFHGRALEKAGRAVKPVAFDNLPALGAGVLPEWRGKAVLNAIGIKTPAGGLAKTLDEAEAIAARVGYPVALKAQASALAHKTEAGGVILNLADAGALREGWAKLHANIARAQPASRSMACSSRKWRRRGLSS